MDVLKALDEVTKRVEKTRIELVEGSLKLAYAILVSTGAIKSNREAGEDILSAIHTYDPTFEVPAPVFPSGTNSSRTGLEHSLFVLGYRQTRGGRMVKFVRDDPTNSDYDRRKVWRFTDNGMEYRTDTDGRVGVDFAPYEHPADVMMGGE